MKRLMQTKMNESKRQATCDSSYNGPTKKARLSEITRMENLSSEVFYEVFDYLDGCDIYKAFSKLNIYFENLLTNPSLLLKVDLNDKSPADVEQSCKQMLVPNKHRIISLILSPSLRIHQFLTICPVDSSFHRLESLDLNGIRLYKLVLLLFDLMSLPRLFSMTVSLNDELYNLRDLYQLLFRLPVLKHNKLSLSVITKADSLPPASRDQTSPIESLNINYSCITDELLSMFSYVPRLRHLVCKRLIRLDSYIEKEIPMTMVSLTRLFIQKCNLVFDDFERFLKRISAKLEVLHVATSWDTAYLDAARWEQLISEHMSCMRKFYFEYRETLQSSFSSNPYHSQINRFTSSFWIKRRWHFEVEVNDTNIFYSIDTHKKRWYDYHEDAGNNRNPFKDSDSSIPDRHSHFIKLILANTFTAEFMPSVLDQIRSVLIGIPLTDIQINCPCISMNILLDLLNQLPRLDSLIFSSLAFLPRIYRSVRYRKMIRSISNGVEITKVKFTWKNEDRETELNHIQFLLELCPLLQYLEIELEENVDLNFLVQFILMKRTHSIDHLRSLCIIVSGANDQMGKDLQTMIDDEQLLEDYTIRRVRNEIYLQMQSKMSRKYH